LDDGRRDSFFFNEKRDLFSQVDSSLASFGAVIPFLFCFEQLYVVEVLVKHPFCDQTSPSLDFFSK